MQALPPCLAADVRAGDIAAVRSALRSGACSGQAAQHALWLALRCTPDASLVATCAHLVVDGGASVLAPDPDGRSALHLAAFRGHADATSLLAALSDSDAIDAVDADGRTALHVAALGGDPRTVFALLASGARRYRRDRWRRIPLECLTPGERESLLVVEMLCVQNRSAEAISILPATRARREVRSTATQTPSGFEVGRARTGWAAADEAASATAQLPPANGRASTCATCARSDGGLRSAPCEGERAVSAAAGAWLGGVCATPAQAAAAGLKPRRSWSHGPQARHALELAAADAGVLIPPADPTSAAHASCARPSIGRQARLASVLRAHMREQEERQARLRRAEARARERLLELVGLQLAAAARVRHANRALRARLAAALAELRATSARLAGHGAGGAAAAAAGALPEGAQLPAAAVERRVSPGVASAAFTPRAGPARPGRAQSARAAELAEQSAQHAGMAGAHAGRGGKAGARDVPWLGPRRASAPADLSGGRAGGARESSRRSEESKAQRDDEETAAQQRSVEASRRCLLLELRSRDLDEREELLSCAEQRLDEQRAALARALETLSAHGWDEHPPPDSATLLSAAAREAQHISVASGGLTSFDARHRGDL